MLDPEQALVSQRVVVYGGDVGHVPGDEPQSERERRVREHAHPAPPGEGRGHRRAQAEQEERRRPVAEHHVLEQVEAQHRVQRQVLDRREQGEGGDEQAGGEREPAQRRDGLSAPSVVAHDDDIVDGDDDKPDQPLRVEHELPGVDHGDGR